MLEVREQSRLPLPKLLRICKLSIAHRILRSAVTVFIIALAISFLTSILASGYLGRAARDAVLEETKELGAYSRFLAALQPFSDEAAVLAWLARVGDNPEQFGNLLRWTGWSEATARAHLASAAEYQTLMDFLGTLPTGERALLVGSSRGLQILGKLEAPSTREEFFAHLKSLKSVRLTIPPDRVARLLNGWTEFRGVLDVVRRGNLRSLQEIEKTFAPEGAAKALAREAREDRAGEFFKTLAQGGLGFNPSEAEAIARGAIFEERLQAAMMVARNPSVRSGWRAAFNEDYSPARVLVAAAESPRHLQWIIEQWKRDNPDGTAFNQEDFVSVSREFAQSRAAFAAEQELTGRYGREKGFDPRTLWLVAVSFLVCVVGIANAMLMSVLERFKEIATMKCLGARNATIGFLFIFESLAMGVLGGLVGIGIALIVAVIPPLIWNGNWLVKNFPFGDLAFTFGAGLLAGLILSGLAAIYPAGVASRMAPLEAMRVD